MNQQTTIRIEGREYSIERNESPRYESGMSAYGEMVLHGVRGAEYYSERWHKVTNGVVRFWKSPKTARKMTLPSLAFDKYFTIEADGTLREATYPEAKQAVAEFYSKYNQ